MSQESLYSEYHQLATIGLNQKYPFLEPNRTVSKFSFNCRHLDLKTISIGNGNSYLFDSDVDLDKWSDLVAGSDSQSNLMYSQWYFLMLYDFAQE